MSRDQSFRFFKFPIHGRGDFACGIGLLVPATHQHSWSRGVIASRYPQDLRGTDRVNGACEVRKVKGKASKIIPKRLGRHTQAKKGRKKNPGKTWWCWLCDTEKVTYSNSLKTSGYAHILMGWFQPSMPKPKAWRVADYPTLKESTITYTIHGMIIQAWLLAFFGL